jgi:hypothetical protein
MSARDAALGGTVGREIEVDLVACTTQHYITAHVDAHRRGVRGQPEQLNAPARQLRIGGGFGFHFLRQHLI